MHCCIQVFRDGFSLHSPLNDWTTVFPEFQQQISDSLHSGVHDKLSTKFSTTNNLDLLIQSLSIMDGMQEYFSYTVITSCGIPRVTLEGSVEDWKLLHQKVCCVLFCFVALTSRIATTTLTPQHNTTHNTMQYNTIQYITFHHSPVHYTFTILHTITTHIILHYTVLHHTTSHYTTLHTVLHHSTSLHHTTFHLSPHTHTIELLSVPFPPPKLSTLLIPKCFIKASFILPSTTLLSLSSHPTTVVSVSTFTHIENKTTIQHNTTILYPKPKHCFQVGNMHTLTTENDITALKTNNKIHSNTIQYNTTRHNRTRHDTTQHNARHNATQHNTTQHNTTQHNTTQHNTAQHNTTQYNTTQHNTTQHNTTQHNTTQHNTIQHNTTQHTTTQSPQHNTIHYITTILSKHRLLRYIHIIHLKCESINVTFTFRHNHNWYYWCTNALRGVILK